MSNQKKLLLFLFFCFYITGFSQERENIMELELFGHSETIISVNYEKIFNIEKNDKFLYSVRAGVGRNPGYDLGEKHFNGLTSLPIVFNVMYGSKHFIQLGFGYTALFSEDFVDSSVNPNIVYKKFESDMSLSLGYRLMLDSGLVCQAYPIFLVRDNPLKKTAMSFGVSMGYSF